jgi:hydroxymethylglutaryl-CoA lyase
MNIYEVGPRDGLQSAAVKLSTEEKVQMIGLLHDAGLNKIEVGSFVHPQRVPNMADSEDVFREVSGLDCELGVLVPNKRGLDRAKSVGAEKFNIFLSPSETFNQNNLGTDLKTIFSNYRSMLYGVPKEDIRVYISHAFGCPIEGKADTDMLSDMLSQCAILGDNVVLCDTVGTANTDDMKEVLELTSDIRSNWSLHLHHNYQRHEKIFDNVQAGYDYGITEFDSSIGGLGGCPFSPGSGANLATEALVKWADTNNVDAGVSIEELQESLDFVNKFCKSI